jgi:aldose 1-epimerase
MISRDPFISNYGKMPNGKPVHLFTLQNNNGVKVQLTDYGARIISSWIPDRNGKFDDVILGYSCLEHYLNGHPYLGATIGRVANKIANAKFDIDGETYFLSKNLGNHHLHGGKVGFESNLWDIVDYNDVDIPYVEFQLISPHGDQGYPGTLTARVRYSLLQDNSIEIKMSAFTDKPTVVNMTNHAYFNLNGRVTDDIYKHKIKFWSNNYLESDKDLIPTGKILSVENTLLDYRELTEIGIGINQNVEPVSSTKGYDHFLIADNYKKGSINVMAEIHEPETGRVLQVLSTLPGMQFYTSNFLTTIYPISNGKVYGRHSAFCVEPSYFVDAPNHPNFQSIKLESGESYNETIVYKFATI